MNTKFDILKRMYLVLGLFVVVAAVLFAKVVNISIVEGDKWRSKGQAQFYKMLPVEAERGNILADDGSFLATSLEYFDIRMDLNSQGFDQVDFDRNIDSLSLCLSKYANNTRSPLQYKNLLIKERQAGNRYLLLKRRATYKELEQFKRFPLLNRGRIKGGLIVEPIVKRHKPFGNLASRTIGQNRENAQKVGLEDAADKYLKGAEGMQLKQRVTGNVWIPVNDITEIQPRKGNDIKTTINVGVQDVASSSLLKALEQNEAEYGVALVMEVKTGAIKAISNLKRQAGGGYAEVYNYAIGRAVEPGSTMKLATIMALMEDNLVDLDELVDVKWGKDTFYGVELKDSETHPQRMMTARKAFEESSNVGMARMVVDKYKKKDREADFIARLKQFRLNQPTGVEIKGEDNPKITEAGDVKNFWSDLSLPWMAMGYEVQFTPLQMLSFYNAVANDGKYMKPYLISEILDNRRVIERVKPKVLAKQIASPSTIKKAQNLLKGVMLSGTGKDLKLPFSLAGKTGTTQVNYSGENENRDYQASLIGYFPADDPVYSCYVMIYKPSKGKYYGSKVAGPVFKEIALKCMNRIPEQVNDVVANGTQYPLYEVGYKNDVKEILDYIGTGYKDWTDADWVVILNDNDSLSLGSRSTPNDKVPNVINMSLRDALYVLENKGFQAEVRGNGRIVAQVPKAGTALRDDKMVRIQLN